MKPQDFDCKLIASDMDGTFLNSASEIPDINVKAVDLCDEKGVYFAICSGRTIPALRTMREKLSNRGFIIGANGGHIVSGDLKQEIYHKTLKIDDARKMYEISKQLGTHLMIWRGETLFVDDKNEETNIKYGEQSFHEITEYNQEDPEFFHDVDGDGNTQIEKMFWMDTPEKMDVLIEKGKELAPKTVKIFRSGATYAEVIDASVNKADGIQRLCKFLGISTENVACFGDSQNDIPMLEVCKFPVAVENAIPEVKKMAKMIVANNNEGGVYEGVVKLLQNK